jgi:hypothetical protein
MKYKVKTVIAAASVSAAMTPTFLGVSPAAATTSQEIANSSHATQRACAEKILSQAGPGAWVGWSGSLDNMWAESHNTDTVINSSSGAAGYYQIMPSTWNAMGCGTASVSNVPAATAPTSTSLTQTLQHDLNILSGRGLSEDGIYGANTAQAITDFAAFFHAAPSSAPAMIQFFVTLK